MQKKIQQSSIYQHSMGHQHRPQSPPHKKYTQSYNNFKEDLAKGNKQEYYPFNPPGLYKLRAERDIQRGALLDPLN